MAHDDMFDEALDQEWERPQEDTQELKKLQQSLHRRESKNLFRSVLAVVLILSIVFFAIIPGLEFLLWNPEQNTYGIEFSNDLDLTLLAYSELFSPSQMVWHAHPEHTGLGTYTLSVSMYEDYDPTVNQYNTAILRRGKLEFPQGFWRYLSVNHFDRASYPEYDMSDFIQQYYREKLEALPDYVLVRAAVSFPEDLSMEELITFAGTLEEANIEWVGIRNAPEEDQSLPLCGMKPYMGGSVFTEMNEYYPCFDIKTLDVTAENFETHFRTLLKFSQDQVDAGRGIPPGSSRYEQYYADVLNYVEENGIMTYGCYVVCDAMQLLKLLDNGTASQIWPVDAWIDI